MIRVVIDTSVLVSAVITLTGPNAALFDYIASKRLRPYLTDDVLAECYAVFEYDHLKAYDRRRVARPNPVDGPRQHTTLPFPGLLRVHRFDTLQLNSPPLCGQFYLGNWPLGGCNPV